MDARAGIERFASDEAWVQLLIEEQKLNRGITHVCIVSMKWHSYRALCLWS